MQRPVAANAGSVPGWVSPVTVETLNQMEKHVQNFRQDYNGYGY